MRACLATSRRFHTLQVFGSYPRLRVLNCSGLRVPQVAVAALAMREPAAPVWKELCVLSQMPRQEGAGQGGGGGPVKPPQTVELFCDGWGSCL